MRIDKSFGANRLEYSVAIINNILDRLLNGFAYKKSRFHVQWVCVCARLTKNLDSDELFVFAATPRTSENNIFTV